MLSFVSDGKKCSFSFREDTHCWLLLITEMWSGSVMSEEKNDPHIRNLAIQNVLIVDAFLRRFGFAYFLFTIHSFHCRFSLDCIPVMWSKTINLRTRPV